MLLIYFLLDILLVKLNRKWVTFVTIKIGGFRWKNGLSLMSTVATVTIMLILMTTIIIAANSISDNSKRISFERRRNLFF